MVDEIQISMRRRVKQLHELIKTNLKLSDLELTHPTDITRKVNVSTWLDELKEITVYGCIDESNIDTVIQGVRTIIVHVQDIIARNVKDEFEKAVQVFKYGDMKIEKLESKLKKLKEDHEKEIIALNKSHDEAIIEKIKPLEEERDKLQKENYALNDEVEKLKVESGYA